MGLSSRLGDGRISIARMLNGLLRGRRRGGVDRDGGLLGGVGELLGGIDRGDNMWRDRNDRI